jgi:hypothetical protein
MVMLGLGKKDSSPRVWFLPPEEHIIYITKFSSFTLKEYMCKRDSPSP